MSLRRLLTHPNGSVKVLLAAKRGKRRRAFPNGSVVKSAFVLKRRRATLATPQP